MRVSLVAISRPFAIAIRAAIFLKSALCEKPLFLYM